VRLLAGCTVTIAAKHDIGVKVLFSHSSEHYIRLYTQIAYGAKKSDESIKTLGYILHCFNCFHRETTNYPFDSLQCPECGSKMDYAGPLWLGSIFDPTFIELMVKENRSVAFKNSSRITKLLSLAKDEATAPITYFVVDKLSGKLGLPSPSIQAFINGVRNEGFQAVQTHFNSRGVRTNAPNETMQKVLKALATHIR
jgi:tRNA (guanine26-N2/guanine27-N2)-dimethyltransferase